jgi:hypothetical protein
MARRQSIGGRCQGREIVFKESANGHLAQALVVVLTTALASPGLLAQQPVVPATAATPPASKTLSQQELDQLLAPIALYPDALVAQVLMASVFPLQIVEAARWSKANPTLRDKALEDAMLAQTWDPATYEMTSSARSRTPCRTTNTNARAVLRLITNSNFVGSSTGTSAGFALLRMRCIRLRPPSGPAARSWQSVS